MVNDDDHVGAHGARPSRCTLAVKGTRRVEDDRVE